MKHRDIDYDVKQIEPAKWRWTIYPKVELGCKTVGEETYPTREQAVAACIREIDRGLDLIKLQFRNAQLRGKISRALHRADEAVQREDDERAKRPIAASDDSVETLTDVFESLRGRALALVDAGVSRREDFPEID